MITGFFSLPSAEAIFKEQSALFWVQFLASHPWHQVGCQRRPKSWKLVVLVWNCKARAIALDISIEAQFGLQCQQMIWIAVDISAKLICTRTLTVNRSERPNPSKPKRPDTGPTSSTRRVGVGAWLCSQMTGFDCKQDLSGLPRRNLQHPPKF
jgi:hypothetical protein